jgi:AcrR family transcriptional regulator
MPPKKPTRRGKYDRGQTAKVRRAAQREALLDAATHVIARRGFAHASVETIVRRAGMSRRTFYEHFKDLRDVLHKIHDRAADLAFAFISAQLKAERDPLAQIRSGIHSYLGAIAANPEVARVVFREVRAAGPEYEPRREKETERYTQLLLGSLQLAHRRGQLTHPPDETTAYAISAAVEAVALRSLGAAPPDPSAAEALVRLAFRAFGAAEH